MVFPLIKSDLFLKLANMGHVFDFNEAKAYEQWNNKPPNKLAFEMEVLYDDVIPLRGVLLGGGAHELGIAVTVTPADEYEKVFGKPFVPAVSHAETSAG